MTPIRASTIAAAAFELPMPETTPTNTHYCAACGEPLRGSGVPFKALKSFNDEFLFADRQADHTCANCAALMLAAEVQNGSAGGVVSKDGFVRLAKNSARLRFLVAPPEPPFAVAFITAKRQHVWWMARTAYDKDLIPVQFGHRQFVIDRIMAIKAALAIHSYEQDTLRQNKKITYVFEPLDREMKASSKSVTTRRFEEDKSEAANGLRKIINNLSLGDLWGAMQIRAAIREAKADSIEAALEYFSTTDPA